MDRTQKELFEEANTLHECPGISMDLEGPVLDNSDNRNFAITSEDGRNMNESHPAMEYPPLYFMLQSYPRLMDPIRSVYAFRWRVSYPLQRKVVLPCKLRQFGLFLTWGEVLILIPFNAVVVTGILYTVAFPSVNATGKIARLALLASLVFAQRNSLVTLLLGMPFDRGMFYHKLAGRLAGLSGLLHTFAYCINPVFRSKYKDDILVGALSSQVTISGSVLVLLFVGITMSSMPQIRQRVFEVFYYLHVLFAAGIVVCAYFHSGKVIPIVALLTWGIDLIIRFIVMSRTRYPRKASLKVISDTVIEVTFSKTKTFAYNPGQFIYLSIPEISWLQWHPFSISSSPSQSLVTLHIRKAGNWTTALFQLASKKSEVEMLLEGPYGNLSVDIMSDRKYKNILLISGGIGITPMQSICEHLLHEKYKKRRQLRRIKFVWVERDPVMMKQTDFIKRRANSLQTVQFNDSVNFSVKDAYGKSKPLAIIGIKLLMLPTSIMTDEEFASIELLLDDDITDEIETDLTEASAMYETASAFAKDDGPFHVERATLQLDSTAPLDPSPVLDMQVYLTAKAYSVKDIPFARLGRPNVKELFLEMKSEAIATGDKRVAVCVSAPRKFTALCRKASVMYSDDKVRFDFHSESTTL